MDAGGGPETRLLLGVALYYLLHHWQWLSGPSGGADGSLAPVIDLLPLYMYM